MMICGWFSPEFARSVDRSASVFASLALMVMVGGAATIVGLLAVAEGTDRGNGARSYAADGSFHFTVDDWSGFAAAITDERFWQKRRANRAKPKRTRSARRRSSTRATISRSGLTSARNDPTIWGGAVSAPSLSRSRGGAYASRSVRTVCVRLCDGYFWPVSFSTSGDLSGDQAACESSCSAPSRLFVSGDPGGDINTFFDLQGRSYASMRDAGAYTKTYAPNCKCNPHPWEEASLRRHEMYAELKRSGQLKAYLAKIERNLKRKHKKRASSVANWNGISGRKTRRGRAVSTPGQNAVSRTVTRRPTGGSTARVTRLQRQRVARVRSSARGLTRSRSARRSDARGLFRQSLRGGGRHTASARARNPFASTR